MRKDLQVTLFNGLPPEMICCAERRVLPHLHNLNLAGFDISIAMRNAYLQGARDSMETLINRGYVNFSRDDAIFNDPTGLL